jgi:hypothetical protein
MEQFYFSYLKKSSRMEILETTNISAIFFAKKHTLFCIVNNPSLLPDKGMLLRNKGMLLPTGSYISICQMASVFSKNAVNEDLKLL